MKIKYDFHIHSCLSPCGDNDSLPSDIVGMASLKGLDAIALTDHNSCKNCPAMSEIANEMGIVFIPGMELSTTEEVHVVCLFRTLEKAMEFDTYVSEHLVKFPNNEEIFGCQLIVDKNDNVIGKEPYLLINASQIGFDEVYSLVEKYDGIMIPAHIDKMANSLISNLGFIPPDSKFTCVELKDITKKDMLTQHNPYLKNCVIITDSDAHYLCDINEAVNSLEVTEKSVDAIFKALKNI